MKNSKKVLLFLIMIISIFGITNVKALGKDIQVTDVTIKDKSGTISVADPVITNDEITSNVTFNKVDDFVTFELEVKNNENEKYKIESIKDNNTNNNIKIDYTFSEDYISKGETSKVTLKLTYKNKLINQDKVDINDLTIKINLVNEEGKSEDIIINPATGDNISHFLVLLIIAITGLILLVIKRDKFKTKIGNLLIVLAIVLIPFGVFAREKYEIQVKFTDIVVKGEFEKYSITINPGNGNRPITKEVTYGEKMGELPENPSKEGYDFEKWIDNNGNEVTEDTVITGPIEIEAKYKAKEYTITYNLDGGTISGNPEKYTIESEDITLKNPSKEGYTFTGWTGTGIDTKTTSVTIQIGSTGNREYEANWSANEDTEYTVTHRYQKLDGTYEEVVVTEYGETDKEVNAPIQSRTGFENPRVQQVTINADGSSSVTYTYTRTNYNFSITDRTYIDSTSTSNGEYPYETEITVKAIEREGYTFKWSDNDTNYERTIKLKDNKELTPIYTANTDTPYKVIHKTMNLDGTTYTLVDTQNLTGTTDTRVTPSVNRYEGFTSPEEQTVTIKGDGTTEVEYQYARNKYTLTLEDSEYIETTATSGQYYYGETITLKAKDKEGYTFEKWSNDSNDEEIELTITGNITIKPIYTANTYTVTFNSNGGGNVNSITVDAGETIQSFTTPTAPSGKVFDGWYTDLESGSKVNTPYTPEGNITLYAHWNNNSFPEVFSEPGECTFNGSNGVLTGDNCSYANGTNKYIDTGINLYNNENHDKDYEIGFTIVSTNLSEQVSQATFMNTKLEGSNYPGLVFRKRNSYSQFDLSSRKSSSANEVKYMSDSGVETVKIYRITNEDTGVQEIFYSINGEEKVKLNDLSQFNPEFDLSVWFGAAPTNAAATAAQRYLVNTTLKDMYIKLGTYQESSNTETYKVIYNANGGSVSPTSKTINIGDQIGTLPTPTAPTGKTFTGWFTGLTDGVKVTSSYIPSSNITIYARYINDISSASISPSSVSILNGSNETITVSNVEEEYTFTSNNTNIATVDSTGKVTAISKGTTTITITGSTSGKTKTINVTVKSATYTVTLNPNGGTVTPTSITKDKGTEVGELPTPTSPSGKEFDGWYTGLTTGIKVTSSYTPNSNVTIYARYKDNPCKTFATDSWSTIQGNIQSNPETYAVGCTKEVDMGTLGKHTVRVANNSTPAACSTEGFSQTACGFVLEFADIITTHRMNPFTNGSTNGDRNKGGWEYSEMRTYVNDDIYNALPEEIKSAIIETKVVSGHGSNDSNNFTTTDKLYLLSTVEVGIDVSYDSAKTETRTLDYYAANNTNTARVKKLNNSATYWFLRSANSYDETNFNTVSSGGNGSNNAAYGAFGVAPAFRIGTMPEFTVSFDTDGGTEIPSQTIEEGGKVTKPSDPTKTGYTFDNWYTDDTYKTVFDFENTTITSDTTIYAHFEELKVCADNENITTLSENTCSNNENITVGDGIVCKRAVKLHEETCSQTDGTYYCSGAGYTESGSKGTSTITYGSCGTSGTLNSGDAFTCDVNGDGDFDELTERFYYVSDYYDTSAKEFDDSTAVLIYYNNVTSGVACNKNTFAYSTAADIQAVDPIRTNYDNWHGPLTVMKQLPTTNQWSNISLKSEKRAILAENQTTHDSPTTSGGTLPTDFSYEGYAARLLTAKELMAGCNLTEVGRYTTGELDSCNYIMENTKYAKSSIGNFGPWLETPRTSDFYYVWIVYGYNHGVYSTNAGNMSSFGARPAIEVLKSNISY